MQEPRSSSTLELVVNEQQMQNMSQIDMATISTNKQDIFIPNIRFVHAFNQSKQLRPSPTDLNQETSARLNNYLAQSAPAAQQAQQTQAHQEGNMFSFAELKSWPTRFQRNFQTKLDEAKTKSDTRTEYIIEVIQAFSGIVIWLLCFIFTIIVPVILFSIGLANLDDCSDRPSLPYLVLTIGFIMTASNLFNLALALDVPLLSNHKLLSSDVKNIIASILNIIFNCLVALLYIISAYMVYNITGARSKQQQETGANEEEAGDFSEPIKCNGTLYNFTFWFITLTLSSFAILSILATILCAYNHYRLAIIRGSTPRSHQATNSATNNNLGNTNSQTTNTYSAAADRI